MEDKELKEIYDELSKNTVKVKKEPTSIWYEFGSYAAILFNKRKKQQCIEIYKIVNDYYYFSSQWKGDPKVDTNSDEYRIYIAAKLKSKGKAFVNPYQNAVVQKAQQKSK